MNATFNDRYVYVTFPYESKIYRYEYSSGSYKEFNGESGITKNKALPYDAHVEMEFHAIENVHFYAIMEDKYRGLFYRFHDGDISLYDDMGKQNWFVDKKMYLTVYGEDFEKIQEIELPKYTYRQYSWLVGKEGL